MISNDKWPLIKLNECCEYISRGKQPKYVEMSEVKTLNQKAIQWGNIDKNALKYHNPEISVAEKHFILKGDIVLNSTGTGTVGRCYYFSEKPTENMFADSHVTIIRTKPELLLPAFLYYQLSTNQYQSMINNSFLAGSTGQVELNKSKVQEFPIYTPSIKIQENIVKILKVIDEKIKNNQLTIKNLDQLSQTLFKHWFIDFEFPNEEGKPYKSSGGEMVESELGNIPKSWTYSYFSNFVKQTVGGDWGKENVEKNYVEQVSIIRGADIPELTKGTDNKIPTRFILKKNYENKKLLSGDIVIEISGGSPTQSTGRSIFINENIISRYNDKVLCTNFCRIIRPVDFDKGLWLQMYINYLYKKNVFFNFENGTTGIKNLDLNAILNKYKIVSPSEDVIHLFSEKIKVILTSIQNLGMENKRLAKLRDTLLPKLLSGEIEIPDDLEM